MMDIIAALVWITFALLFINQRARPRKDRFRRYFQINAFETVIIILLIFGGLKDKISIDFALPIVMLEFVIMGDKYHEDRRVKW